MTVIQYLMQFRLCCFGQPFSWHHEFWYCGRYELALSCSAKATHAHTQPFYGSLDFVRDNPGEPVPEETFTHWHLSWSSVIPYLLSPFVTIQGILPVQFTCLTVFFHISLQVFFGLPLGLAPSMSYSIHLLLCDGICTSHCISFPVLLPTSHWYCWSIFFAYYFSNNIILWLCCFVQMKKRSMILLPFVTVLYKAWLKHKVILNR